MSYAKLVISLLFLIAVFLGLRLGMKTVRLDEGEIIAHYGRVYGQSAARQGFLAQLSDCHAVPSTKLWVRLVVQCRGSAGYGERFEVGYWGQLVGHAPFLEPIARGA